MNAAAATKAGLDLDTGTPLPAGLRAGERSAEGGRQSAAIRLSPVATSELRAFLETAGVELSAAVFAAWGLLLSRYAAQEGVVFGISVGSGQAPLRMHLTGAKPVEAWLRETSGIVARALGGEPHAQAVYETAVSWGPAQLGTQALRLQADLAPSGELELSADYDAARFPLGAVANVLQTLTTILERIPESRSLPLADLPLVSAEQLRLQFDPWNNTRVEYPSQTCIHEFLEQQAQRTPDAAAVTYREQTLSYADLDRRANQLAHHLRKLGAGPDRIVALSMERSLEMMLGLVAILKSGAAYLPLDPAYPLERLQFMLEDSGAALLLTRDQLVTRFPGARQPIVRIDSDWSQIDTEPVTSPSRTAESGSLAYLIYTSGSTGKPKGVMIEHRQVANFFAAMDAVVGPEPGVWLAVTSISFDISVLELFWTLARGFHVVLQAEGEKRPAQMAAPKVTHLQCTPSMARFLLSTDDSRNTLASLRKLLIGGEVFPAALAAELARATTAEIHNMYGPTETTVWSTTCRVRGNEPTISIGRPIANTEVYILDERLRPLPVGAPGELCIGGAGVVRGYLDRPELTQERFPANAFRPGIAERLYRTGDLARYRPNGDIEFLGRIDNQIKILGFRVEIEEVEAVLGQHPGVQAGAVIVREDVPGEPRLVAYVVARGSQSNLAAELRIYLQQKLPPQMLPTAFFLLHSLPATPNGKINRKALFELGSNVGEAPRRAETQAAMEDLVASVWKELLAVDSLSISENIFDLGATSMLTIEAAARLRDACQREVALTDLFKYPSIKALAAHLLALPNSEPQLRRSVSRAQSRKDAMLRRTT